MRAVLFLALVVAAQASAQTVYRCGPDGRSYAQQPCAGGSAVAVGDARSELERDEGEVVAGRQARLARAMERDRLDTRAVPPRPLRLDGRPLPTVDHAKTSSAGKDFRAVDGPTKKRAKRRAA